MEGVPAGFRKAPPGKGDGPRWRARLASKIWPPTFEKQKQNTRIKWIVGRGTTIRDGSPPIPEPPRTYSLAGILAILEPPVGAPLHGRAFVPLVTAGTARPSSGK
jgi:hypothetical protein